MASPKLLLFFLPTFYREFEGVCYAHALLPEDDAQTAAPVFRQRDPRDFDFRG
jgi:hypothetical protein